MLISSLVRGAIVAGLAVATIQTAGAANIGDSFASVDAFIKSMPQGAGNTEQGYGDLTASDRRDWAGVVDYVVPDDFAKRRVVILAQQADGSYRLAAQGPEESADGGTSHMHIDDVKVKQGSVGIIWSWSWHGCGGDSTQQIKLYHDQWRIIGAEIHRYTPLVILDGYDMGDEAELSHNLLTGKAIIHFKPVNGKAVNKTLHLQPSVELLDDNYDSESGSIKQFDGYAKC